MKETIMLPTTTFTTQTKLVDSGAFSPRIAVLNPYIKIKKLGKIFGVLFILFQGIISWVLSLSLVYTVHCLFVAIPKQDLRLFVTKATQPNIKYGCRCAKTTVQQFLAERIVRILITYVQHTWSSNTFYFVLAPALRCEKTDKNSTEWASSQLQKGSQSKRVHISVNCLETNLTAAKAKST